MSELLDRLRAVLGDRYLISREIGRGGMAAVFLADDRKHERQVAVKVLHPELAAAIGGERFLREINIAAHLRHPHIVPLLDSGEADGLLYYVMPYVEGESLRQRLAVHGQLEISEAMRYWRDVVDAIAYAHRQGILHRDIKPENVLLADRHASVVDFGIGKALRQVDGDSLTGFGMAIGTPAYMAPEQAMATGEIDHRADIYALGVLAYEMLSGRVPNASLTPTAQIAAKISGPAPDVRENRPEASTEIARAIKRCLEPEPEKRWQSADELLEAVESVATPSVGTARTAWSRVAGSPKRRNAAIATVALMAVVLSAFTYVSMSRAREKTWAREAGIPQVRRLADAGLTDSAFVIADRARAALPGDAELDSLWKRVSTTASFNTAPEGAQVYWTSYRGDTATWHPLGETPLKDVSVPVPRLPVTLLIKYEKPGYRTSLRPLGIELRATTPAVLDGAAEKNAEMVRVRGGIVALPSPTRLAGDDVPLPDFYIDRFEVTNREFKEFVAAGGYRRRDLWEFPFSTPEGELSWDDAMSRFVDKTGRPGPASWEGGDIPQARENHPVSGISWYEARAYAKFAGKELPTIFHWRRAAHQGTSSWMLPRSNIEGSGLANVGAFKGMTPYGVHDMAGNIREWCVNADGAKRYILGGGWSDYAYVFSDAITVDPLDRSEINGVRLMQRIALSASTSDKQEADPFARPAPRGFRDYAAEKPVSDDEFRSFLPLFDYDRSPLNAVVEASDSTDPRWIKQTIAYDAAYGKERMRAYLFLPRNVPPPYQTAVFFPGANAVDVRSSK
ncbi:MAG: bifunctional serine/threonine-protein kinase/formylglycine-generating enzyme family protein, partial [Gemmatimonadota bacterium]|nr:bifunctional serine/threonine-protein kinase/formylglycine-generating enzyme family protein [Gemmatimonadota bacterium]